MFFSFKPTNTQDLYKKYKKEGFIIEDFLSSKLNHKELSSIINKLAVDPDPRAIHTCLRTRAISKNMDGFKQCLNKLTQAYETSVVHSQPNSQSIATPNGLKLYTAATQRRSELLSLFKDPALVNLWTRLIDDSEKHSSYMALCSMCALFYNIKTGPDISYNQSITNLVYSTVAHVANKQRNIKDALNLMFEHFQLIRLAGVSQDTILFQIQLPEFLKRLDFKVTQSIQPIHSNDVTQLNYFDFCAKELARLGKSVSGTIANNTRSFYLTILEHILATQPLDDIKASLLSMSQSFSLSQFHQLHQSPQLSQDLQVQEVVNKLQVIKDQAHLSSLVPQTSANPKSPVVHTKFKI